MAGETLRCPLCGTALPKAKYERVLKKHEGLKAHVQHLRDQAQRLKAETLQLNEEKKSLRKQYADFRRKQQLRLGEALKSQRQRVERSAAAKARKEIDRIVREERRQSRRQRQDLHKVQSRLASYEKRMTSLAEKSKRQNEEIRRLKEQIEKGVTPQIEGLLEEKTLLRFLRDLFPHDGFDHTGKGGDIVQTVLSDGKKAGVIVYECKKHKHFSPKFVLQASEARKQRSADYAILVTSAFPAKKQFFFVSRDVLVISPAGLEPVVHTARQSLIRLLLLRASEAQKQKAVQAVYSYLAGTEYSSKIANIAEEMLVLSKELKAELSFHKRNWKKRYGIYRAVFGDIAAIDARLRKLVSGIPTSAETAELPLASPRLLPYPAMPELERFE